MNEIGLNLMFTSIPAILSGMGFSFLYDLNPRFLWWIRLSVLSFVLAASCFLVGSFMVIWL